MSIPQEFSGDVQETAFNNGGQPQNCPPSDELEEVLIAVMGATGSGKSTFINLLSGSNFAVSRGLKSCTSAIQISNTFELSGRMVTLVDTPGFDDTFESETAILKKIAAFLSAAYQCGRKLSGVIYAYRISDFKVGGIARRNFSLFRELCGDNALSNVIIVTNMWGEVSLDLGEERERELQTDDQLFKAVLDKGALMLRHDNTLATAQSIVRRLVDKQPKALRIQRELIDDHRDISETAAGIQLKHELEMMRLRHAKELAEVQEEMRTALTRKDAETKKELAAAVDELQQQIRKIENDRDQLSKDFNEMKTKVDDRIRKLEAELDAEKAASKRNQPEEKPGTENAAGKQSRHEGAPTAGMQSQHKPGQPSGSLFSRFTQYITSLF